MSYRIAIGGIHIESTTFTSYRSKEEDFRLYRGEDLLHRYPFLGNYSEIEFYPTISARAIPGGTVSKNFFDKWKSEFLQELLRLHNLEPLDGVLLDIHGAMSVEDSMDPEGDIAEEIKNVLGSDIVVSATMDLHGNVSDKLFENCEALTCYRTAPHIDVLETKERALQNLITILKSDIPIYRVKVDVPILLPGEKTSTEVEPGKTLYSKLQPICENKEIIDASIWMGFPWADQQRCHSALVFSGFDKEKLINEALFLAEYYWDIRNDFVFVGPTASLKDSINLATSSTLKPFFISDTGDNPGAGGAGDLNGVLRQFVKLDSSKKVLIASIYDPESTRVSYQHAYKEEVQFSLGGKADPSYGKPLELNCTIKNFFDNEIAGKSVMLTHKNIDIIVTENRYQYGTNDAFVNAGVTDINLYDIVVVKMGYLEPDLKANAKDWVMALTRGAVNQDIVNIKYKNLQRPLFPFSDFEWKPEVKLQIKTSHQK